MSSEPVATAAPVAIALIVTTVARTAWAAIAAESFARHHPDVDLRVVVVDDRFGAASARWQHAGGSWGPASSQLVGLSERAFLDLGMALGPDQLVRALTPPVARELLVGKPDQSDSEIGPQHSVILIPDTAELLGAVGALSRMAATHGVALVRRRDSSVPLDGRLPDHVDVVRNGRLHTDLAAFVGKRGLLALEWWADRVRLDPLLDLDRINPWQHCWLDEMAVAFADLVSIVSASSVAGFQNADEVGADLERTLMVRFDEFDETKPWQFSSLSGDWPRVMLSEHPALAGLVAVRAERLSASPIPASFEHGFTTLANGHSVDDAMRWLFRTSLIAALRHGHEPPPNPFAPGYFPAFSEWLAEPNLQEHGWTRHLVALTTLRPDLAAAFGHDPQVLFHWAQRDAVRQGIWSPSSTSSPPRAALRPTPEFGFEAETPGLNVVGLLSAQLGNGEHGRLMLDTLKRSAIPHSIVDHEATVSVRDTSLLHGSLTRGFRHDVDLLLLNADLVDSTLRTFGRSGRPERATIGFWAWETTVFPDRFLPALQRVDEVWGVSRFVADAISPLAVQAGTTVVAMPAPMPPVRQRTARAEVTPITAALGISESRHVVFFSFDYFSVAERKLPWAAVEAFRRAFPIASAAPDAPLLVIKSLNHEFYPLERERLLHAVRGRDHRDDIVLIEAYVSAAERDALVMRADTYLSLHRSEGFGLTMAEAMAVGTPVIATGWSGNLSFMTPENSFLVDVELVDIAKDVRVYGGLGQWAEPSIDHAAKLLQLVTEQPEVAQSRAAQATADLLARAAAQPDAGFVIDRLRSVRRAHHEHLIN
jgi:glycosyltransferase involved in cell wall biosynthesis